MRSLFDRIVLFLASGFGLGYLAAGLTAPLRRLSFLRVRERWSGGGLFGSLLGLAFAWAGWPLSGGRALAALAALTVFGIWISGRAETLLGQKDDPRIIIDEVAGMLWSLVLVPLLPDRRAAGWIFALLLFRVFDVLKLPLRRAQDLQGGMGVMMDDILSGLLANLVLQAVLRLW